jgi:hypothetical protein
MGGSLLDDETRAGLVECGAGIKMPVLCAFFA